MPKPDAGCVQPSAGPIGVGVDETPTGAQSAHHEEKPVMQARVGAKAPDFEATAYVDGGFKNIKLSSYRDKWVVLCFYPGDFTFV